MNNVMNNKRAFTLLLGIYKDCKVYQVVKSKKGYWSSYFIIEKNNKKKRIYSSKVKKELSFVFHSSLAFIALRLVKGADSINYMGNFYKYFTWEAWKEDSIDNKSTYVLYDYKNYIVLEDQDKIEEVKAYFLVHGA